MAKFLQYLDPKPSLSFRVEMAFADAGCVSGTRPEVLAFLQPLRAKDLATYEHSCRVGILATQIGEFAHLDPKALLYAGLLHDIGKAQTRLATLQKTEGGMKKTPRK